MNNEAFHQLKKKESRKVSISEKYGAQKKLTRKSDELIIFLNNYVAVYLTYLSTHVAGWNWHLIPDKPEQVVKASSGHYPLPFLISE